MRHLAQTLTQATIVLTLAASAHAQWNNAGGNERRNGLVNIQGPDAPTLVWTNPRPSIIGWQPVITDTTAGPRVFVVRQSGFPPEPAAGTSSPVVAIDLATGADAWVTNIPFTSGNWTTHILGARDGRVYVSRSGGGGNVSPFPNGQAPIIALDAATGSVIWTSTATTAAGPYEGAVFDPATGDLIVGDFLAITRISAADGSQIYRTTRTCSVSGSCHVAINPALNAAYLADAIAGGHAIKRFNLATGAFQYQSPTMPGFTLQNGPFVGATGLVHLPRTQNNPAVDAFYAFTDTGSALTQAWSTPAGWTVVSEGSSAADGSVFLVNPQYQIERRSASGALLHTSTITVNDYAQRSAVDALGRLYHSDAEFGVARLHSLNPDLTLRWTLTLANQNVGAPAIGPDGTLVIADTASIRAYRTTQTCYANCDASTGTPALTPADFVCFLSKFRAGDPYANCDASTGTPTLTPADFVCFLNKFRAGC